MISKIHSDKYIFIHTPKTCVRNLFFRIDWTIDVVDSNKSDTIKTYFEIDKSLSQYACYEYCDPIVFSFLSFVMKNSYDIYSESPITLDLYHKLTTLYMPVLAKGDSSLSVVRIFADVKNPFFNGTHVGTGVSGGIDSLCTTIRNINSKDESYRLTDLVYFDIKTFEFPKFTRSNLIKPVTISNYYNLPIFNIHSDIMAKIPTCSGSLLHYYISSIMITRWYWRRYYLSSTYYINDLNVDNYSTTTTPDRNEMLLAYVASTNGFEIFPESIDLKNRYEKIKEISSSPPPIVNPCFISADNCGWCLKCIRTLICIDANKDLEKYSSSFNIDEYVNNKDLVYSYVLNNDSIYLRGIANLIDCPENYIERSISNIDELVTEACSRNVSGALFYSGYQKYIRKQYSEALDLFLRSESSGSSNPSLFDCIGDIFFSGKGVEKDLKKAGSYYLKAYNIERTENRKERLFSCLLLDSSAESISQLMQMISPTSPEDYTSLKYLGMLYRRGLGFEKNLLDAAEFLKSAYLHDVVNAAYEYFDVLWDINTPDSLVEMISVAKELEVTGDKSILGRFGRAYRYGRGVDKNLETAANYY